MDEKGLELISELTREQIKTIACRFKLNLASKNNHMIIPTLEFLCDYEYFRLERDGGQITIIFLK